MSCPCCENVPSGGPTQKQQYVDPFAAEPLPYLYTCEHCGQRFGSYDPRREIWQEVTREEALWMINSHP